jgi:CRP-like cAMP-binding protein
MVSPELLRRYPFFSFLSHEGLREVAQAADEVACEPGDELFQTGTEADALYLLISGGVDLRYTVIDESQPELRKDFLVGTVNPGELLGISAVVEPYRYGSSAVASAPSTLLRIDAAALMSLCDEDLALAYGLQRMVAKAALERLHVTHILLAAATAPS